MEYLKNHYISWAYENDTIPAHYNHPDILGYCRDMDTLETNLSLWKYLNTIRCKLQQPLPPAKRILPTIVSFWNIVKGGIDVYSRFLKNVKQGHNQLQVNSAIWIRLLMTFVYNTYHSMICIRISVRSSSILICHWC
jgi:hypothetical protein